jgi:hypothetical protein
MFSTGVLTPGAQSAPEASGAWTAQERGPGRRTRPAGGAPRSSLLAGRFLVGQRASDNCLALRMHAVVKLVCSKALRTSCCVFHQTLREVIYFPYPRGSTVVRDRRPRLGSRSRQRWSLIELLVGWHCMGSNPTHSHKWLSGNFLMPKVLS